MLLRNSWMALALAALVQVATAQVPDLLTITISVGPEPVSYTHLTLPTILLV